MLPPVVALALSLWGITSPSYWRDEAATISAVRRPFGDLISMLGNVDAVHAAYYMLMWPLVHLFGTGALVLRLPSAIAVAVTAAMVAALGRRLSTPWVGLAAGVLYSVLPVASRYGQEARSYAWVVALAVIASYLLIRVLGAEPGHRRRWLIGYGVGLAVLGIANIFGLLLIPAHAVTVALQFRQHNRRYQPGSRQPVSQQPGSQRQMWSLAGGWLLAALAAVVVCSPLLILGWTERGQIAWLAVNKSSSGLSTVFTLPGSALISLLVVAVIVISLVLAAQVESVRRTGAWRLLLAELSLPWLIIPPFLLLAASVISPVYTSRYILMCIPPLALLGGAALVALGRIAGPVALAIVILAGLNAQLTQRQPYGHYDNIKALDKIVAANYRPGDAVLYTNPNSGSFGAAYSFGLDRLRNISIDRAAVPSSTLAGSPASLAQVRARLQTVGRVWVVEINHCVTPPMLQGLSGRQQGQVLTGLPLHFVRMWHERGDWLLLYAKGAAGGQAPTTACRPAS